MVKRAHYQSMEEQIDHKGHASAPFHTEKSSYLANKLVETDNNSIQLRAYQIHQEKGGSDMENWLEAEQSLKDIDQEAQSFSNEGNPNFEDMVR